MCATHHQTEHRTAQDEMMIIHACTVAEDQKGFTMEDEEHQQQPPPQPSEEAAAPPPEQTEQTRDAGEVIGSAAIRPVFLGNLKTDCPAEDIAEIFSRPIAPPGTPPGTFTPIPIDRVDTKRGYCFVFLKDAATQADKEMTERFVSAINGM
jgi:hypothetical protein